MRRVYFLCIFLSIFLIISCQNPTSGDNPTSDTNQFWIKNYISYNFDTSVNDYVKSAEYIYSYDGIPHKYAVTSNLRRDNYSNGEIWLSDNSVTRTIDKGSTFEYIYESQSTQETSTTVTGNYSYPSFYEHFTYSHTRVSSNHTTSVLSKQTNQILSQTSELIDVYDDVETIKILIITTNEYILIDSSLNKYRNNISKTYKYYKNNVLLNTVTDNSFRDVYYDSNNREIEYISYDADNNKTAHYLVSHFNGPDGCVISNSYSDWTDTDLTQYSKGTTVTYTILQEDENKIVVQMDQETVQLSNSISKFRGIYTYEKY